ncbi:MAG TPA: branched-chain amino acid ABC transporter permease [Syntrophorhabdales bacterium]|nr:branched-chain amino acid ABC transporter permease [Syntrophorhabdales bacterium]
MKIFSPVRIGWSLALILAILLPLVLGEYLTSILLLIAIWSIMAVSLNLLYGYTGQLSLGHSAFLGIGAYALGLIAVKLHIGFWPAFFASTAISGLAGFLIGIPALKLRGPYFVLVTLGFAAIVGVIVLAWVDFTGGANGLAGMPRPNPIPLPWGAELRFDSLRSMYYFTLFFLVLIAAICHRLVHSLIGRTFLAISHDENLAESLGINTMQKKLISFTISAMFSGVAGALYASYNVVISPDLAYFARGMDVLACLIVGGAGTMAGPIVGTFVMTAIPEGLQIVPYLKTLINGIILLLFIIFLPAGITGGFKAFFYRWGHAWKSGKGRNGIA